MIYIHNFVIDFNAVKDALLEKGYEFVSADVKLVPQTTTVLSEEGLNSSSQWRGWCT